MALIDKLSAIGDAIREKTGKTDLFTLEQMPIEIAAIESGGGGEKLTLFTPSIEVDTNTLTITDDNGGFVDVYDLYIDGKFIAALPSRTEVLTDYIELIETQTLDVKVQAKSSNFNSSEYSNIVAWRYLNVDGTIGLEYLISTNGAYVSCTGIGTTTDTEIYIATTYDGIIVKKIAEEAFKDNDSITKVVLGDNVGVVDKYAFSSCSNLSEVIFNDELYLISDYAFEYCSSLHSIDIPTSLGLQNFGVFQGCINLVSVKIKNCPTLYKTFSSNYFNNCRSLKRVDLSTFTVVPKMADMSVFKNTHADLQIKVPVELYEEWKNTTNWVDIADKIVTEFTNEV